MDELPGDAGTYVAAAGRTLRIADLLIATVVLAIGAGLARGSWRELASELTDLARAPSIYHCFLGFVQTFGFLHPFVSAATVAVVTVRLLSRRSGLRGLAADPGTLACTAAVLALAFGHLENLAQYLRFASPRPPIRLATIPAWSYVSRLCGMAVMGAWLGLILGGRWRASLDPIEQAGRILGIVWIGSAVLNVAAAWAALAFS